MYSRIRILYDMIINHIYLSAEYWVFTCPLVNLHIKPNVDQWRPVTDYCEHLGSGLPRWLQGHVNTSLLILFRKVHLSLASLSDLDGEGFNEWSNISWWWLLCWLEKRWLSLSVMTHSSFHAGLCAKVWLQCGLYHDEINAIAFLLNITWYQMLTNI